MNTSRALPLLGLTVCAICTALPGWAANPEERFPIAVEDIEAHRTEVFTRVDGNGDGLISAEEFSSADLRREDRPAGSMKHRPRPGHPFASAELDDALYAALDANGDGVLSRAEFSTGAMADARRMLMQEHAFARMDRDADGYLTPDEFPPGHTASIDLNQDGQITRDELRSAGPRPRHH